MRTRASASCRGSAGGGQQAGVAIADKFRHAADRGGHHGNTESHGLEHDVGEPLGEGRVDDEIGAPEAGGQVPFETRAENAVVQAAGFDLVAGALEVGAIAEEDETEAGEAREGEFGGADEVELSLFRCVAAGGDGYERVRREAEAAFQVDGGDGGESGGVDGVVDDGDAAVGHETAAEGGFLALGDGDDAVGEPQAQALQFVVEPNPEGLARAAA
ncbi:MAG TPA: hypothetical protein PLR32_03400, partial [candidate division Zixibacteria bacterium]|nr:hypothetical protein [candidate division Zixibacteria bacterium]